MKELNPDARLLIVDDSVANLSLLQNILNRLGFPQIETLTDVFAQVDLNELIEQAVPLTQPKWKGQALADGRSISIQIFPRICCTSCEAIARPSPVPP